MKLERHHVQFFTAVWNDWLRLLDSDEAKNIVIKALQYQVKIGHVKVPAFVILPNHLLIRLAHWQLATLPEDYKYSSARFYEAKEDGFGFLTHHSEI